MGVKVLDKVVQTRKINKNGSQIKTRKIKILIKFVKKEVEYQIVL